MKKFKILSINVSKKKGVQKKPVKSAELEIKMGIKGDAHAGDWHRQVSLLAEEDIKMLKDKGLEINFGDFAENITTEGISLSELPIGSKLYMGNAVLEVTQIGKECHSHCEIYKLAGECAMPKKGIFAKVLKSGAINRSSQCYAEFPSK